MKQKKTLIVGGTKGSGYALVKFLEDKKHLLSIMGRKKPPNSFNHNKTTTFWEVDITDELCLFDVCESIINRNGYINNLIFFQRFRGKKNDWEGEIEASLTATKNTIEYFTDPLKKLTANINAIVVISSNASYLIADEQPLSYHVAKAGLKQLVRYYAVSLGSKNIRVNAVSPGTVLKDESKEFYLNNQHIVNLYKNITPIGRMGTPQDIANVVDFLCSSKAAFITGQDIVVDGGLSLQWQESLSRRVAEGNKDDK
ncbi:conserved hypothetical protein [Candidatus Desulfarcum epimagneticum]|uniref:Uncharacterized protein n=1 Tax=uncultured Desulfobacteraceae bacterium TaxID=218296 RepID=A0A484HID3_9BACT|nr:conserved hypothetical protein [uncultured Desulfobacteraceae bacterium]